MIQNLVDRARSVWDAADRTQKIISVAGAVLLIAVIGATFVFAGKPRMEPIFPGANANEQGAVRDAVMGYGIPVEISPRGDVLVPADKMAELKMRLSVDGKAPVTSGAGGPIAATNGIFSTPTELDAALKTRKEQELARSIMTLEGVNSAIVHINFGKDSPFAEEKLAPSAVVNLVEKAGAMLSQEEGKAIARLIQNSIPGLTTEHVSVISSQGRMIFDGQEYATGDADANRKLESEAAESKRRERELQKRLDAAFGVGSTIAMVQVELNMDEVSQTRRTVTPSDEAVTKESVTETLSGSKTKPTAGAGADSNVGAGVTPTGRDSNESNNYQSEQISETKATDESTSSTKKAAGEVTSMVVNVLVDRKKVPDETPVTDFVTGYLANAGERDYKSTVTATDFAVPSNTAQVQAEQSARIQQIVSILPIAALLIVGFMLVRTLSRAMPAPATTVALPDGGTMSLPGGTDGAAGGGAGWGRGKSGPQVIHHNHTYTVNGQPASQLELEQHHYDLSQLDDIGSTMTFDQKQMEQSMKDAGINFSQPLDEEEDDSPVNIGMIREKVDVPLEQIRRLAKERPETVAVLLKGWIMEDR